MSVSGLPWSSLKLVKIMFFYDMVLWAVGKYNGILSSLGLCDICSAVCWSICCARSRTVMTAESG